MIAEKRRIAIFAAMLFLIPTAEARVSMPRHGEPGEQLQFERLAVTSLEIPDKKIYLVTKEAVSACYIFKGERKIARACPPGFAKEGKTLNWPAPSTTQYFLKLSERTRILDSARRSLAASQITVGDVINTYGTFFPAGAIIEAEVVRNLSKPLTATPPLSALSSSKKRKRYDGIITQVFPADDTFEMRTRDGTTLTIENPIRSGSFVSVEGTLNGTSTTLRDLTEIRVNDLLAPGAIPVISKLDPGIGPPGTLITVAGTGFTLTGNDINIGKVKRAVTGLRSPHGRTLSFVLPATLCSPDTVCTQVVLPAGDYPLSVSNEHGVSNEVKFQVIAPAALRMETTTLPQVVVGTQYEARVEARGGTDSYSWRIANGALPPGLSLVPTACIRVPCFAPAKISGIPTVPGSYSFTIEVTSGHEAASRMFTIVVVTSLNTTAPNISNS